MGNLRASILVSLAIAVAGCDSDTPTSPATKVSTQLTGRVLLRDGCDTLIDKSGVQVRSQLGATAVTNSQGYFTIEVPLWDSYLSLSKDGYYKKQWGQYGWEQDSGRAVARGTAILFAESNYSGKFEGEPKIRIREYQSSTSTEYLDSNGVLQVRWDPITVEVKEYTITAGALNDEDRPTSQATVYLLIADHPNIDPNEPSSYGSARAASSYHYPSSIQFTEYDLMQVGIDPDKPFFVAATSAEPCMEYGQFGTRRSEVIRIDP
jgi:hypothetical protein